MLFYRFSHIITSKVDIVSDLKKKNRIFLICYTNCLYNYQKWRYLALIKKIFVMPIKEGNVRVEVHLTPEENKRLEAICKKEDRSKKKVCERAVLRYIEEYEKSGKY